MQAMTRHMKVVELMELNHLLLLVLARLGVEHSFGDKTLAELCSQHGLDVDTVLLLCRVYSDPEFVPSAESLSECEISDVLRYMHQSHRYYLNYGLEKLSAALEELLKPCHPAQKQVIWTFFSDYTEELRIHFEREEEELIPYVRELMLGKSNDSYSIAEFEKTHSNVDEKLSDFKSIVMTSLPVECSINGRIDLLNELFHLQQDLRSHTYIEDNVLVPMAKLLENPYTRRLHADKSFPQENSTELSDREKEILVSVAQGKINKLIAEEHHISINTVITHRKNITRKTGIKTVAGLTVYAILNNLIDINTIE